MERPFTVSYGSGQSCQSFMVRLPGSVPTSPNSSKAMRLSEYERQARSSGMLRARSYTVALRESAPLVQHSLNGNTLSIIIKLIILLILLSSYGMSTAQVGFTLPPTS